MSKIFGERLKKLRLKKDLTQLQLAKTLNIDNSTIGYWERGIKEPNSEMFIKIADLFDVSLDYLLGREEEKYTFKNKENQKKIV